MSLPSAKEKAARADEFVVLATVPESNITDMPAPVKVAGLRRYVPLLVWLAALAAIVIVPLKILSYGYLPEDDALRHAAKAVSGKSWSEILILANWVTLDHNPGWHWLLGAVHHVTGWGTDGLVFLSVAGLFLLFSLTPLAWVRRPEIWLAVLLATTLAIPRLLPRLAYGRPLLVSSSALMFLLFMWSREWTDPKWKRIVVSIALCAATAWIHGAWYLFVLPAVAFAAARQWRAALWLGVSWLAGSFLGALLTGHPIAFLAQAIQIVQHCFSNNIPKDKLAFEFRPSGGDWGACAIVIVVILARILTRTQWRKVVDNAPFILAVMGFLLGLRVQRFWVDWGLPALLCWLALQAEEPVRRFLREDSPLRLGITLLLAMGFSVSATQDRGVRWSISTYRDYLSPRTQPELVDWLPRAGGIVYNVQQGVFYRLAFANPHAQWRYALGFEPTLMPPENLAVYERVTANPVSPASYETWVKKMRPEDCLVIDRDKPIAIPQLEWRLFGNQTWIGRLPRGTNSLSASAVK